MGLLEATNHVVLGSWDLTSFLSNATEQVQTWGRAFLTLVGVVGVVWAAFQIISGLMSQGKKQVSYGTNAILLLVSGALVATGLDLVLDISKGGQQTIQDLGGVINLYRGLDLSTIALLVRSGLPF